MALIRSVRDFAPKFGDNCFLAETAAIIGDVTMGNDCSIWYGAVLRGDVNTITLGNKVNVQDNAVLHCLYKRSVIDVGDNVTISHNVCIHGASIERNVLVGIGATVLDNAVLGENSIIAAGSVILSGKKVESGSIYAGVPAKKVGEVSDEQSKDMIEKIANNYLMYSNWYK